MHYWKSNVIIIHNLQQVTILIKRARGFPEFVNSLLGFRQNKFMGKERLFHDTNSFNIGSNWSKMIWLRCIWSIICHVIPYGLFFLQERKTVSSYVLIDPSVFVNVYTSICMVNLDSSSSKPARKQNIKCRIITKTEHVVVFNWVRFVQRIT